MNDYQALLLVSFGGPEGPNDVLPFLENVLRGRNVPRERMLEVAEHYQRFGGRSPINDQNRALLSALKEELVQHGPLLPVYWGNRNWHPLLADTLRDMAADGITRALAFVTSAYSSYSSCRQYLEDIDRARADAGPGAPEIHKLRPFFNHPGFIQPMVENLQSAFSRLPEERRAAARLLFSAHSIPVSMAATSRYVEQLRETSRLVAEGAGRSGWELVYQSRSGPPSQPWLEPDVADRLRELAAEGVSDVVLLPVGFLSDHMEVVYDLDVEAQHVAHDIGLNLVRAATAGTHPRFVTMIRELILERMDPAAPRLALGPLGPAESTCQPGCCPPPPRAATGSRS